MDSITLVKSVVSTCLQLCEQGNSFDENTELLGAIPEVSSLTIMTTVTCFAVESKL